MIDIDEYAVKYFRSIRNIVKALPNSICIPLCLSDPSFIIGYSDIQGKFAIQLLSRKETPEIVLNGNVIRPGIWATRPSPIVSRV